MEGCKIAGICSDDDNSNDGVLKRLDEYWVKICELLDENWNKKYSELWQLVKCVMLISHGNTDPEQGFSIKHMLNIHG